MLNPILAQIQELENRIQSLEMLHDEAAFCGDVETACDCAEQIERLEAQIADLRNQWAQSDEDWVGTF